MAQDGTPTTSHEIESAVHAPWAAVDALPTLGPADVSVWRVPLTADDSVLQWARGGLLSSAELSRVDAMATDELRARQACSFAVVRSLLGSYLDLPPRSVRFQYSALGKPSLPDGSNSTGLHFSVSHAQAVGLYAFTHIGAVGVDIETHRPLADFPAMLATVLTEAEQTLVAGLSPAQRRVAFFHAWTMKESCLKATGEGIAGLQAVETVFPDWTGAVTYGARWLSAPQDATWSAHRLQVGRGQSAAVVVRGCAACIRTYSVTPAQLSSGRWPCRG